MRGTTRLCLALLALPLTAALAAAEVKTEEVTYRSGNDEVKGFLARPDTPGHHPGIVVIQEWWGLTDWIRDNAKRLASQGYVCLAPNLYRTEATDDQQVAARLMRGLPQDRAIRDLKAAVDALAAREDVKKDQIGSIGWCMGGGFSLQLALNDDRVTACVMCYGRVVTDAQKLQPLHAAVLGIFGEQDRGIPAASVRKFEDALKADNKNVAGIHFYKAGHGFMRPGGQSYREEAANDAWKQIEAFFAKTLH